MATWWAKLNYAIVFVYGLNLLLPLCYKFLDYYCLALYSPISPSIVDGPEVWTS